MPSSSPVPQTTLTKEHPLFCFDVLQAKLTGSKTAIDTHLTAADEEL